MLRVGSGKDGGEKWDTVHHRHGVGQMNEACEVLPSWVLSKMVLWS